jgi:hypothetical protein
LPSISASLERHVFGWEIFYLRKIFVQGLKGGQHSEQGRTRRGLYNQTTSYLADNDFVSGQLKLRRNPQGLMLTIPRQSDVAFGLHR